MILECFSAVKNLFSCKKYIKSNKIGNIHGISFRSLFKYKLAEIFLMQRLARLRDFGVIDQERDVDLAGALRNHLQTHTRSRNRLERPRRESDRVLHPFASS